MQDAECGLPSLWCAYPCDSVAEALACVCMQATSAASERSFSKAGLIVVAKRMVMTHFHVDDLHLVGWRMAESGWATQKKERAGRRSRNKRKRGRQRQSGEAKAKP